MYALSLLFHLIYNIIHFYVVVWAEKFGEICKNVSPDVISHCKTCLKIHSEFNRGLGLYFLVIFSFCQIIMIVNLFSVISFGIMEDFFVDSWERPFMSLSFLFYALNFTGVILSITLTSEKSFNELKRLSVTLREFKGRLDWHKNEKKIAIIFIYSTLSRADHRGGHWGYQGSCSAVREGILHGDKNKPDRHDGHQLDLLDNTPAVQSGLNIYIMIFYHCPKTWYLI